MNRHWLLLAMHLFASCLSAQDLVVRTATDPEATAMLGERIVLKVDVLGRDAWAKLSKVPTLQVPGAIVFVPPSQSTRLSETIEGESYTGQQYEWWIYPQRVGELTIPKLPLSIENKNFGAAESPDSVEKTTEPQALTITKPEGVAADVAAVTTSSLKITQSWSDQPESVSVGDGVTRTIVRVIQDAPSLILPPINFGVPDGVRSYVKEAITENRINRGDLAGRRTDAVTYVFEDSGDVKLPSVTVTWFDTASNMLRTETLAGLTVTVTASQSVPSDPLETLGAGNISTEKSYAKTFVGFLFAFVLAGIAVFVFRKRISSAWMRFVESRSQSESTFFSRFETSAKSSAPAATLRDLTRWSDVVQSDQSAPRLDHLFTTYGDAAAKQQLVSLQSAVDGQEFRFDTSDLQTSVRLIRRGVKNEKQRRVKKTRSPLPPMRIAC